MTKQLLCESGSLEPGNVIGDEVRATLKPRERSAKRRVSLAGGPVEAVMGRELASHLPHAFGGVELGRVARKAVQFDFVRVPREPFLACVVEPVARPVVDDQEELAGGVLGNELEKEFVESVPIEDGREAVREVGILERDGAEDMRRLPHPEGIDTRLMAYPRPGLVECSVEPEARFVLEEDEAAAGVRFFFKAGKRTFSQMACFSASARARRLRGRCTENPIWLSIRGTE